MSEIRSKTPITTPARRPLALPNRPYVLLGFGVVAALTLIVALAYLGVVGPDVALFTPEAALFGVACALVVVSAASVFTFFTMRSTNRVLAKLEQDVQFARDLAQDGRLGSLEGARVTTASNAMDNKVDTVRLASRVSNAEAEITRLAARLGVLETPPVPPVPVTLRVAEPVEPRLEARAEPFGDVHAVIDIEGIGTRYATLLNAAGVHDTRELWRADAAKLATAVGVPRVTVVKWQQMAELLAIKGIGPQYAELLVCTDVRSIADLAGLSSLDLASRVAKTQADAGARIQGNTIGITMTAKWIRSAQTHDAALAREPDAIVRRQNAP